MDLTKDQILAALPTLGKADIEAVYSMAGHLLGQLGAVQGPQNVGATLLADMTFTALGAALGHPRPYQTYSPTAKRQFEAKIPTLISFLDGNFKGWDRTKNVKIAFLQMIFGLLVKDLRGRGVNPTIGILITNLQRVPEVFDNSFPGYRESGIAVATILKHFK